MKAISWFLPIFFAPAAFAQWQVHSQQGSALERQGCYAEAVHEFEAALAEAQPDQLPLTLHNLGAVNRELGRYAESDRYYRRAISIWERALPAHSLELASSLSNLGALQLEIGSPAHAEPLLERAYNLRLAALGPDAALTASSLHQLARLAHERRRYLQAADLYRRAAESLERAHGSSAIEVADVSHNWAMLYADMGRDADALPLFERAAAIYGQAAQAHPKLAIIQRNLAELHARRREFAEADALFSGAIALSEASLPPDHPQTGLILAAYGKFLNQTHRKDEARAVTARAQRILSKSGRENATIYTVDVAALAR
jgi:tetratricopeptide (TPR) repeat protein